jgi:folate-binding protein YgfZ
VIKKYRALALIGDAAFKTAKDVFDWMKEGAIVAEASIFGKPGLRLLVSPEAADHLIEGVRKKGLPALSEDQYTEAALLAGWPRWGVDINSTNLILEGPFAPYVSRDKGCYPGQEIVERVFTYGNVAKKLVGLKVPHGIGVAEGAGVYAGNEVVGKVTAAPQRPIDDGRRQILALVKKPHFDAGQKLNINSAVGPEVEVTLLPGSFVIEREKEE